MLFLRSQSIPLDTFQIQKMMLDSFSPELYKKDAEMVITGGGFLSRYQILSVESTDELLKFSLSKIGTARISPAFENVIYAGNHAANIPARTARELELFLEVREQGPRILRIKRESGMIQTLFIDESARIFVEKSLSVTEWERFAQVFQTLQREINVYLKKNAIREAEESVRAHRELLRSLKKNIGIPEARPFREWHIYQERHITLFPWELDESAPIVRYFSGSADRIPHHDGGMVTLYDENLKNAVAEAGTISLMMRAKRKSECFSLAHFVEDSASLSGSSLLHLSAHGGIVKERNGEEKTVVEFSREVLFLYAHGLSLALLNACRLGSMISGVVEDLLVLDSTFVIATPYEIPDASWLDFGLFYRHYRLEASFESILFFMLLRKKFRLFYRIFSPYYVDKLT